MTDNEIIKDLDEAELFLRNRTMDGMSLELNEYDIGILRNISQVCARSHDEITSQKAEIERLQKVKEQIKKENNKLLDAQMFLAKTCDVLEEKLKTAKAEAIKEFAENVTYCKDCVNRELMTSNNQHFCNRFGGYVSEKDCCSRGVPCKRNGGCKNGWKGERSWK